MNVDIKPVQNQLGLIRRTRHFGNPDAERTLATCIRMSTWVWEGTIDGETACIFGLAPPTLMSDQAYLWLTTTDVVDQHKFVFTRYSQLLVQQMLTQYSLIVGDTLVDATRSIRWLRWLKAEFGRPCGQKLPFWIRREAWQTQ